MTAEHIAWVAAAALVAAVFGIVVTLEIATHLHQITRRRW